MNDIIGHEVQYKIINDCYNKSYAWMITGNKGIGKFSLIKKFAESIIKSSDDLLIISKEYIKVEDSHTIVQFLMYTASNKVKVVIIDNFESISYNAANALLKTIEEPHQKSLIFLVSHNASSVPATIKSRVRTLHFYHLSTEDMNLVFNGNHQTLFDVANGSPGMLYRILEGGGLKLYRDILQGLKNKNIQGDFSEMIIYLLSYIINRKLKLLNKIGLEEIFEGEKEDLNNIKSGTHELLNLEKRMLRLYNKSKNFNLDKNHIANTIFL